MSFRIIADIGNSFGKLALYDGTKRVSEVYRTPHSAIPHLVSVLARDNDADEIAYCSVADDTAIFSELTSSAAVRVRKVSANDLHSVALRYDPPLALGADRVAAIAAAAYEAPQSDLLVVDAGTAITCDIVREGVHLGGSISPGIAMRFEALHEFTAKLPQVETSAYSGFPANSTQSCIAAGVVDGVVAELKMRILDFLESDITSVKKIFFTGGDAKYLENSLKSFNFARANIAVRPELVLDGVAVLSANN